MSKLHSPAKVPRKCEFIIFSEILHPTSYISQIQSQLRM